MPDLLTIQPTVARDPALHAFLTQHTDPVRDLLAWADAFPPLGEHSRLWLARAADAVVGLAIAFPLQPDCPALVVRATEPAHEEALLGQLLRARAITHGFAITEAAQLPLYERLGRVGERLVEWQYTLAAANWTPRPTPEVVRPSLAEIDAFYRRVGAPAWNPLQYETGPYVAIAAGGRLVAAAGTHFRTPRLAQIGNVFTDPAWRGRGLARACTAAVAELLVAAGAPTLSLFVAEDNTGARALYEQLGFAPLRALTAFTWTARD